MHLLNMDALSGLSVVVSNTKCLKLLRKVRKCSSLVCILKRPPGPGNSLGAGSISWIFMGHLFIEKISCNLYQEVIFIARRFWFQDKMIRVSAYTDFMFRIVHSRHPLLLLLSFP